MKSIPEKMSQHEAYPDNQCRCLVRKMTPEDIRQVALLEQRTFSEPWSEKGFADALAQPGAIFLVAKAPLPEGSMNAEDSILGYCGCYSCADEGEITNVAVADVARRAGIGSCLIAALLTEAEMRGIRSIFLEVRQSNIAAQKLYEKHGFSPCGIRRGFYRKPTEDALLMNKDTLINATLVI